MLANCLCDPHKLTYISAIVTAVEAVAFGVLNIVLICMNTCAIKPPDKIVLGFEKFWSFYFYDEDKCATQHPGYVPPSWVNNTDFPLLSHERSHTTVNDNFLYQITYLVLHSLWFMSAFVMIYGNARKLWGFYLPWLLVSVALSTLDITVSAFCIQDLVTITGRPGYRSAMFWILAMYFRIFLIWFINASQFASAFNAFCKSFHKRTKQNRRRKKIVEKHAKAVVEAEAAVESRVRAEAAHAVMEERVRAEAAEAALQARMRAEVAEQQLQRQTRDNLAFEEIPQRPKKIPPPVPKKPAAPSELRPFSYLNPAFRPNDPTDVEGMRTHPTVAPEIPMRPLKTAALQGPYFPTDGYSEVGPLQGFPKRHDSLRNNPTQEPHTALRRFSSTRGVPYEPRPDYDMTLKPGSSAMGNMKRMPRVNLSPEQSPPSSPSGPPQPDYHNPPAYNPQLDHTRPYDSPPPYDSHSPSAPNDPNQIHYI